MSKRPNPGSSDADDEVAAKRASPSDDEEEETDQPKNEGDGANTNFEFLDHPADVQMHSWGDSLEEALAGGVCALYATLTETSGVEERYSFDFSASGRDAETLVYALLHEALCAFTTEPFFVGRRAKVIELDRTKWTATCRAWGESWDEHRHKQGTEVKAITYSNMQIRKTGDKDATDLYVIFDI